MPIQRLDVRRKSHRPLTAIKVDSARRIIGITAALLRDGVAVTRYINEGSPEFTDRAGFEFTCHHQTVTVFVGEWIVYTDDDFIGVYSQEDFEQKFETVYGMPIERG